jgi:hypothetical protein
VRFLADECCDAALVHALRSDGHDVLYAIESLRGATDGELLARSFSERGGIAASDSLRKDQVFRTPKSGIP